MSRWRWMVIGLTLLAACAKAPLTSAGDPVGGGAPTVQPIQAQLVGTLAIANDTITLRTGQSAVTLLNVTVEQAAAFGSATVQADGHWEPAGFFVVQLRQADTGTNEQPQVRSQP